MKLLYLDDVQSKKLLELGFERRFYKDEVAPFDFYLYKNDEWCLGGNVCKESLLAPKEVYEKGARLLSTDDLVSWFEKNNYSFELTYAIQGIGYRILATNKFKNETFKAKGTNITFALGNVLEKILKKK